MIKVLMVMGGLLLIACGQAPDSPEASERQAAVLTDGGDTSFVGMEFVERPDSVAPQVGTLVSFGSSRPAEHAVSVVRVGADSVWQAWFEQTVGMVGMARRWRVLDVLELPTLEKGFFIPIGACELDGEENHALVAIAKAADEEVLREISAAWRADQSTGRFEKIETGRVTCINEGWGL